MKFWNSLPQEEEGEMGQKPWLVLGWSLSQEGGTYALVPTTAEHGTLTHQVPSKHLESCG